MKQIRRKLVSVILALAMVILCLPEYVSPVKTAKAAAETYTIRFITVDDNGDELENLQGEELPFGETPSYPIWIAGTKITTLNQDNVLGDAAGSERITFSETTEKYVLTILTGDEITLDNNADVWNSLQKALIYIADTATKPLEIVASDGLKFTSGTAYHGIFNESEYDLTVNGNVSIKLTSEVESGQELNGIYCVDSSMTITGDVTLNFPNGKSENGNGLFTGNIHDSHDITVKGDVDITGAGFTAISSSGNLTVDGTLKLICADTVDYGLFVLNGSTGNGTVTLGDEVSITMGGSGYGIYATGTITLPEARTEISTNDGIAIYTPCIRENKIVIPDGYGISTPEDGKVKVIADTAVDAMYEDFYTIVDPTSPDVAASVVVIEPYIEVQFVNADEDQTVFVTTKGFVGKAPKYTGETPTMKETDAGTYTFDGWSYGEATYASDDLPTITEDMTGPITFTAAYIVETKQYEVTFYDEDGKTVLLEAALYNYGTKPGDIRTPEKTPTKKEDDQYTYEFEGWDPELSEVTGDANYTAKYKAVPKEFTIKFVNEDGKELQSTKVAYGTKPTYMGTTPTKEETAQFRYVFDGWTPEIVEVTGEATYTAKFAEKTKSYTIKFVNEDGTELQSSAVDYGKKPEYTGATPTKAADSQYTYTFKEWSPEIVTVTGEATYKATYDKKEISADDPVEEKGEYQLIGDKKISYKQKSGAVIKAQIKCTLHDENTFSKHKDVKSSKRTLVEGVDYKKTKGSVIIEFLPEYLDSLEVGSTMITVSFEDGNDVEIELEILPADAEEQKDSPKNADTLAYGWMIVLLGISGVIAMLVIKGRKEEDWCATRQGDSEK